MWPIFRFWSNVRFPYRWTIAPGTREDPALRGVRHESNILTDEVEHHGGTEQPDLSERQAHKVRTCCSNCETVQASKV